MRPLSFACCLLAAQASHAAVFIHTQTFPDAPAFGFFQPPVALSDIPLFDPGLGTLESFTASFNGTLSGSMFVQNANPVPVSGQLGFSSGFSIIDGSGNALGGANMGVVAAPFSLGPAFDSTMLVVGPGAVSGSFTLNSGDSGFSPYGVSGSIRRSALDTFVLGVGTAAHQVVIGGTLTVTYNYTPVPEPASLALFTGWGLLSVIVWRRWRLQFAGVEQTLDGSWRASSR